MALSAKNRLSKKGDFDTVFKVGKATKGSFLFIRACKNSKEYSRFGFIISSKVSGKAVIRNRIRRTLSDFIRLNLNRIAQGYDIIIVMKNGKAAAEELRDDLEDTLKIAKIIV